MALVRLLPGLFLGPGRAPGSLWRRRLYPNNLALVTSAGVAIPLGSSLLVALKTRKWSVYHLVGALVSRLVGVRVVRARTSFFRELVRAHVTVRRNVW